MKINHHLTSSLFFTLIILSTGTTLGQSVPLTVKGLKSVNVKIEDAEYKGKKGIRVTGTKDGDQMAIVTGTDFKNGTIELEVSGKPLPGTDTTFRGFIGLAFRIKESDSLRYECFYLRPTNGRAGDQLRRNHSTQYVSEPGFPWFKLRKENPGLYESYVDLVAGEWTKVKIVVKDTRAQLFVNGSDQPCLIVNDLKKGITTGSIGLWIGVGTDGYFRDLRVY